MEGLRFWRACAGGGFVMKKTQWWFTVVRELQVRAWCMLVAARGIGEDGGCCPCECSHDVVVVAGRMEKTKMSRTTNAVEVTGFPTRARRATIFQRV